MTICSVTTDSSVFEFTVIMCDEGLCFACLVNYGFIFLLLQDAVVHLFVTASHLFNCKT